MAGLPPALWLSAFVLMPLKSCVLFMNDLLLYPCEYCSIVTIERSVCTSIVRPRLLFCFGTAVVGIGGRVLAWDSWFCLMLLPRDSLIGLAFCMVMVWSSLSASRMGWLMTEALSETRSAGAAIGPELVIFSLRMLLYLTESWRS